MSKKTEEKTEVVKVTKFEIGFDAEAMKAIEKMKNDSRIEDTPTLIMNSMRVFQWYLENRKHGFYTKREDNWIKVDLEL